MSLVSKEKIKTIVARSSAMEVQHQGVGRSGSFYALLGLQRVAFLPSLYLAFPCVLASLQSLSL